MGLYLLFITGFSLGFEYLTKEETDEAYMLVFDIFIIRAIVSWGADTEE
jgi:hypothetical protein